MIEAVERTVRHVEDAARVHAGGTIVCVTHCDIIRGTLAHYLGLSLDNILRFEVGPGSISTVEFSEGEIGAHGACVIRVNEVPA